MHILKTGTEGEVAAIAVERLRKEVQGVCKSICTLHRLNGKWLLMSY